MDEFTLSQSQKLAAFSLPPLNSLQLGFVSFSKPTQVCKRLAFIRFLSPLLKGLIKGAPHIIKQSAPHDCNNFVKSSDTECPLLTLFFDTLEKQTCKQKTM